MNVWTIWSACHLYRRSFGIIQPMSWSCFRFNWFAPICSCGLLEGIMSAIKRQIAKIIVKLIVIYELVKMSQQKRHKLSFRFSSFNFIDYLFFNRFAKLFQRQIAIYSPCCCCCCCYCCSQSQRWQCCEAKCTNTQRQSFQSVRSKSQRCQ